MSSADRFADAACIEIVNISKSKDFEKLPSVHPRKTPRLTRDEDSASASRSRGVGDTFAGRNVGNTTRGGDDIVMGGAADEDVSFVLKVEGAPCRFLPIHCFVARPNVYVILDKPMPLVGQYTTECYSLTTRFLRYYLVKPRPHAPVLPPPPNSSFENIFSACRTIVAVMKDSGDLHDQVKMQLERCVGELAQDLGDKKEKGVKWIKPFNETCAWFEERVVSMDDTFPRSEVQVVDDFSA